jgi:hypothetical protein
LSNITEEEAYEYFEEVVNLVNKNEIDAIQILECIENIISSYSTGYYSSPIPFSEEIEKWLLAIWDITSLEMTEYITFIALNLELKNICIKIKEYAQDSSLPKEILKELNDSLAEIDDLGLCSNKEQNDIYFSRT